MDKVIDGIYPQTNYTTQQFYTKEEYDKLQAENERLKEENKELKKLKFKSDGIELLQDANLNLHNANVKYRQALQEIRAIAEELKSPHCTDCTQVLNKKGKCTGECMKDYTKQIQAKINEVIGVE